jgi:outer membrane protein insertion porin family
LSGRLYIVAALIVAAAGVAAPTGAAGWRADVGVGSLLASDKLVEIRINGNENIPKHSILAVVESAGILLGMDVTNDLVETGLRAIRGMGWFAQVVPTTTRNEEGVVLIYTVVEYAKVEKIDITGNRSIATDQILAVMSTKSGGVFNRDVLGEDLNRIEELYTKHDYSAVIAKEPTLDKDGVLHIVIAERTIEEIRVEGNTKTKTYVILREMETKPGDTFDMGRIAKDLERLANLGFFEPPVSRRIEIGSDLDKVILTVIVTDKRTGQFIVGMAYSSTTKWLGRLEASESNLGGRGRGADLLYERGGYGNKSSFELGWQEPWIDRKRTSLGLSVFNKVLYRFASTTLLGSEESETRYDERRKGGSVTVGRPRGDYDRYAVTLRRENVLTEQIEGYDEPPDYIKQDGTIFSTTLRYTRDTRDYYADPSRGVRYASWIELGFGDVREVGNTTFRKYNVDLRRYLTLGKKRKSLEERVPVLALRLEVGIGSGTMPFFEQYFLGGAESLRGYLEDRFWGHSMALLNIEYRHPFSKALEGVLFADFGDAWGSPQASYSGVRYEQDDEFKIHAGYGIGIRFQTPIGPIRIDYGIGEEGSRTHFSIGHVF